MLLFLRRASANKQVINDSLLVITPLVLLQILLFQIQQLTM